MGRLYIVIGLMHIFLAACSLEGGCGGTGCLLDEGGTGINHSDSLAEDGLDEQHDSAASDDAADGDASREIITPVTHNELLEIIGAQLRAAWDGVADDDLTISSPDTNDTEPVHYDFETTSFPLDTTYADWWEVQSGQAVRPIFTVDWADGDELQNSLIEGRLLAINAGDNSRHLLFQFLPAVPLDVASGVSDTSVDDYLARMTLESVLPEVSQLSDAGAVTPLAVNWSCFQVTDHASDYPSILVRLLIDNAAQVDAQCVIGSFSRWEEVEGGLLLDGQWLF